MKLKITVLKAPWPAGARVGDVVEVDSRTIPGWALGKCHQVGDDEEVTAAFPEKDGDGAEHPEVTSIRRAADLALQAAAADLDKARTDHAGDVRKLKADHEVALADLQRQLADAKAGNAAEHQKLLDSNAALTKELADAKAALAAKANPGRR